MFSQNKTKHGNLGPIQAAKIVLEYELKKIF